MTALDFLEIKSCNICEGEKTRIVHAFPAGYYDHQSFETASWDGRKMIPLTVVQCERCGLVYTNPAFKESALDCIYPADIINVVKPEKLLANTKKFDALLKKSRPHMVGKSVVDIGTRYGVFPLLASRAGYDAIGVEYNAASVEIGKSIGAPIYQGSINTLRDIVEEHGLSQVDNIFMVDVLEHLTDPRRDLTITASLQQPGARLFLMQMDLDSPGYRLFRRNWAYLQPAAHMYYFNEKSVRLLLEKTGYRIRKVMRMPLLENLNKSLRGALNRRLRKLRGKPKKVRMINGKPLYLERRQMSADDMFLVIAERLG